MEKSRKHEPDERERGEHNEIGFYDADEQGTYDERAGTQGEPPDENAGERIVEKP